MDVAATSRDLAVTNEAQWMHECNLLHCKEGESQIERLLVVNRQLVVNASAPSLRVPVLTLIVNGRKVRVLLDKGAETYNR